MTRDIRIALAELAAEDALVGPDGVAHQVAAVIVRGGTAHIRFDHGGSHAYPARFTPTVVVRRDNA